MANRTLFELLNKESVLSTDIIPIQLDTTDGVLSKITVGQLRDFISEDNIHILDVSLTDTEQKLEIVDMYLDHIAGRNFTLYVSNNVTVGGVVSKSYILAELIFSNVNTTTYKIYIKYNTIIDDDDTITKKENSITATISKSTGLVSGSILYATKDYATYKSSYIDNIVDESKFTTTIGDGVNSTYTINHNLGTEDILVSIIKLSTKENSLTAFTIINTNSIRINFGTVIGVNTYRVIVL